MQWYACCVVGWSTPKLHEQTYEAPIGEDYILGSHWEAIGDALRGALNGQVGRCDCGTLDGILLDAMKDAGIDVKSK